MHTIAGNAEAAADDSAIVIGAQVAGGLEAVNRTGGRLEVRHPGVGCFARVVQ